MHSVCNNTALEHFTIKQISVGDRQLLDIHRSCCCAMFSDPGIS